MSSPSPEVSKELREAYDEQYNHEDTKWRELGAVQKTDNVLRMCNGRKFSKVLECGAGEGSILRLLGESGEFDELFALEISSSGVARIKARNLERVSEVKQFDGYSIPYGDDEFDLVYCSHVVEHVEFPRILLRELKRVSKYQIFEVPLDYTPHLEGNSDWFLSYGHINLYTPALFKHLLATEGFSVIDEHSSRTDVEVIRYNWYVNMGLRRTAWRELQLRLRPVFWAMRKMLSSRATVNEFGYSAYTCLTKGAEPSEEGAATA